MIAASDVLAIQAAVAAAPIFNVRCYATEQEFLSVSTEDLTDEEVRAEVTLYLSVGVEEGACSLEFALRACDTNFYDEVDFESDAIGLEGNYCVPTYDRARDDE